MQVAFAPTATYARGGRIAAGGGLFAGGPFAIGLIAGAPFASGLDAAHRGDPGNWGRGRRIGHPLSTIAPGQKKCCPVSTRNEQNDVHYIQTTVCTMIVMVIHDDDS